MQCLNSAGASQSICDEAEQYRSLSHQSDCQMGHFQHRPGFWIGSASVSLMKVANCMEEYCGDASPSTHQDHCNCSWWNDDNVGLVENQFLAPATLSLNRLVVPQSQA